MPRALRVATLGLAIACAIFSTACSRFDDGEGEDVTAALDEQGDEFAAHADADTFAGPAPLSVHFTARATRASGRVRYHWNFDDHRTSDEQNPSHSFRRRGWYLVTMDAVDVAGNSYRMNLQLHAWRPWEWARMQQQTDMRIVARAVRELQRKRERQQAHPAR